SGALDDALRLPLPAAPLRRLSSFSSLSLSLSHSHILLLSCSYSSPCKHRSRSPSAAVTPSQPVVCDVAMPQLTLISRLSDGLVLCASLEAMDKACER